MSRVKELKGFQMLLHNLSSFIYPKGTDSLSQAAQYTSISWVAQNLYEFEIYELTQKVLTAMCILRRYRDNKTLTVDKIVSTFGNVVIFVDELIEKEEGVLNG